MWACFGKIEKIKNQTITKKSQKITKKNQKSQKIIVKKSQKNQKNHKKNQKITVKIKKSKNLVHIFWTTLPLVCKIKAKVIFQNPSIKSVLA